MNDEKLGTLLVLIAATGLGTIGILGRLAFDMGLTIPTTLALRFSIGSVVFYLFLGISQIRERKRKETRFEARSYRPFHFLTGRNLMVGVGLGAFGYAVMSGLFFWGYKFLSVGMVAIVFYMYPIFVVMIAAIFLKEKVTSYTAIALALAFGGVALIAKADPVHTDPRGVTIVLGAAIVYAGYVIVSRSMLSMVDSRVLTAYVLPSAAATFLFYGKMTGQLMLPSTACAWAVGVALAIVGTVIPIFTFLNGLSRIGAVRASILSTFEPVVAVMLGAALLHDSVTLATILGGTLILAGAILVNEKRRSVT
jgi:drug/metabolite transporter (DMT)-like permease